MDRGDLTERFAGVRANSFSASRRAARPPRRGKLRIFVNLSGPQHTSAPRGSLGDIAGDMVFGSRPISMETGRDPERVRHNWPGKETQAAICDKVVSHDDGTVTRHIRIWITDGSQASAADMD